MQEIDTEQKPIYFVSRVLQGAEIRYRKIEKLALALVVTARRLRPYFQTYEVIVRTDQPIRQVLQKPDLAGRMVKWSIELSEYGISYEPRGSVKAQVLSDFLIELTSPVENVTKIWVLSVNGSSNLKGSGAGVVLEGPDGVLLEQSLHFEFKASNNQAEYEALIAGMALAQEMGATELTTKSDSQLITGQVGGTFQTKDPQLMRYLSKVHDSAKAFRSFKLTYVPRKQNMRADLLSKLASTKRPGNNRSVIQETVSKLSIDQGEVFFIEEEIQSWMGPIIAYLADRTIPADAGEARKLQRQATKYAIIAGKLYRRGLANPLLKCLTPRQAEYVMTEVHEGVCGTHIGGRALVEKLIRAGYYWPTLKADCLEFVMKCDKCQKHADLHQAPPEVLYSVFSPWPFNMWGTDILGPFPLAPGQVSWYLDILIHIIYDRHRYNS